MPTVNVEEMINFHCYLQKSTIVKAKHSLQYSRELNHSIIWWVENVVIKPARKKKELEDLAL